MSGRQVTGSTTHLGSDSVPAAVDGSDIHTCAYPGGARIPLDHERCPRCDYSLHGLPLSHRCPECGLAYDEDTLMWQRRGLPKGSAAAILSAPIIMTWVLFSPLPVILVFMATVGVAWWMHRHAVVAATTPDGLLIGRQCQRNSCIPWEDIEDVARDHTLARSTALSVLHRQANRFVTRRCDAFHNTEEARGFLEHASLRLKTCTGRTLPSAPSGSRDDAHDDEVQERRGVRISALAACPNCGHERDDPDVAGRCARCGLPWDTTSQVWFQ